MVQTLRNYFSLLKFSHTLFALPLAGIAFVQASENPSFQNIASPSFFLVLLSQVLLCMVFLRSSAMAFNRLVDRKYDAANPRTAKRELPRGRLSPRQVLYLVIFSGLLFVLTASSINPLTGILALPLLALVYGYSYTKRFTCLCHFVLGLSIGLVPLAVWIALIERVELLAFLWGLGILFYIAGFDILYACQDYDFDRKRGLHSLPASFGIEASLWIARSCHVLALLFFIWAGWEKGSQEVFYFTIGCVGLLFMIEHILVRPKSLKHIPLAFFHINASISSILFIGVCLERYLYHP